MGKNLNGERISWSRWKQYDDENIKIRKEAVGNRWSPSYSKIKIGEVELYFHYNELIAFKSPEDGMLIAHSHGESGRGLAINKINRDKRIRIDIRVLNETANRYFSERGFKL